MNKADRERLARRQRMLAREQGQAPEAGIRGTSGDISLRTPKPVHRGAPPPKTPDPQAAQTAARLKSLTPLYSRTSGSTSGGYFLPWPPPCWPLPLWC